MKVVHYIATDSMKYVEMAARSAASVRKFIPDARVILHSDLHHHGFDEVHQIENLTPKGITTNEFCEGMTYFIGKIAILGATTHEHNLYLDCDTEVMAPVDLFGLLDKFDMAAAHAPHRRTRWSAALPIPAAFPDFNLGILLFRRDPSFFQAWGENYLRHPRPHDQTSFRLTAWDLSTKLAVLPPEYNRRPKTFDYGQETRIKHG